MFNDSINKNIIFWAITLMISVPLITIVLGEIIDRLRQQESNFLRFFQALRAVVLPVIVITILTRYVFQVDTSGAQNNTADLIFPLVLTVLYIALTYTTFIFVLALKAQTDPKAWENKIPSLFKAIFTGLVFVIPVFMLLQAWGIQVGDFAKVIGIAGVAIGFALQDALSSITKGFLLVVDKPFAVGDWIEVDGIKGKVIDISWRSTRLEVAGHDIVVIPNLIISDNSVYNYTAIDISYRDELVLGFSYDDPPSKVKAILMDVLQDCPDVMKVPNPRIYTISYDDFSIGYKMYFHIKEYISAMDQERIRDSIMSRVWYAADRGGISIPYPINIEGPPKDFQPDYAAITQGIFEFLSENRYFSTLKEDTRRHLANVANVSPFSNNETLFNEGDIAHSIGLIRYGEVELTRKDDQQKEYARSNDLICEIALMGRRANHATAKAIKDTEIIQFSSDILNPIIEKNPVFARALNTAMEDRLRQLSHSKSQPKGNGR